jgi:hypothetical protein
MANVKGTVMELRSTKKGCNIEKINILNKRWINMRTKTHFAISYVSLSH